MKRYLIIGFCLLSTPSLASGWVSPEIFAPSGTSIGDGVTDATPYVQMAWNSGGRVRCQPGSTYLLRKAGLSGKLDDTPVPFALRAPAGLYFDGTGCTLKVAVAGTAADVPAAVVPTGSDTTPTANITLVNVTIDQQGSLQPIGPSNWVPAIFLSNTPNLQIDGLTVNNAVGYCGNFVKAAGPRFNNLRCNGSLGQGWAFGAGDGTNQLTTAVIRSVYTTGVLGSAWPATLPGNPATFYVQDSTISDVTSVNDAAGWKVEGPSYRNIFRAFSFIGGSHGTNNSGFKVQNDTTGNPSDNTVIGLNVNGSFGTGIYETGSINTKIIGYTGVHNASGGALPEIWIEGANTQLYDWSVSRSHAADIIYLRAASVSPTIGAGQIIAPLASGTVGVLIESSSSQITVGGGTITDSDDKLEYYVREIGVGGGYYGAWNGPAPTDAHRGRVGLTAGDYASFFGILTQGDATRGTVTLAPGATNTLIRTKSAYAAGELVPLIDIQPVNAAARALGPPRYTIVSGSGSPSRFGFSLLSAPAFGTETFTWSIVGWQQVRGGRS